MSAEDLIKNGKAKDGDTVRLLWRNELTTQFSQNTGAAQQGQVGQQEQEGRQGQGRRQEGSHQVDRKKAAALVL